MDLSAEQFAAILQSMQTSNPSKRDEKRRAQRVEQPSRIEIFPCKGKDGEVQRLTPLAVMVRNFSSRGIAVLYNQPMAMGTQFIIRMKRKNTSSATILCTVVHCDQLRKDTYSIGAEFTCTINEQRGADHATAAGTDDELKRIRQNILD